MAVVDEDDLPVIDTDVELHGCLPAAIGAAIAGTVLWIVGVVLVLWWVGTL